jgi:hypothetical protein
MLTWKNFMSTWDFFRRCMFGKNLMLTLTCKDHVNMRFFSEHAIFFRTCMSGKKSHVRKKIACCCLHVDMFFRTCMFEKKSIFEKKSHVDIKNCMLTCNFLYVDMQKFHVNMRVFSERACSEKIKKLHVNVDNIDILTWQIWTCMFKFQVHVDMHSSVCGHTSNNSQYELSLMINTMQYGVVKSFIQWQLGYKVLRD